MTACRADTQKQTGVLVDAIPEGSFEWDIISRRIMPYERSVNDGMRNRTAFTALSCQFRSKLTSHCNIAYCLMGFVDEFEDSALKPAHRAR